MADDHPEWWKGFFHGVALDLWRAAMTPELSRSQAEFIARHLPPPPARVVDVPCGNGRIALELARRGYRVTGIDIAADFIREAREQGQEGDLEVEFLCADMRELPAQESFDAAICWGNSFGYLGDVGDAEFISALGRCVRPGGPLVMDLPQVAEVFLPGFRSEMSYEVGGIQLDLRHHYDPTRGVVRTQYTFRRDGVDDTREGFHRIYTCREVIGMLERAGFTVRALLGGLTGEPFALGGTQLIVIAER